MIAATGLLLSTILDLVVSAHYVAWNWRVIRSLTQWASFIATYESTDVLQPIVAPDGFLPAYRVAVDGFPVVRAVLEPLGIVLACACAVYVARAEAKRAKRATSQGHGMQNKGLNW